MLLASVGSAHARAHTRVFDPHALTCNWPWWRSSPVPRWVGRHSPGALHDRFAARWVFFRVALRVAAGACTLIKVAIASPVLARLSLAVIRVDLFALCGGLSSLLTPVRVRRVRRQGRTLVVILAACFEDLLRNARFRTAT